jgi:hypothetical protein
VAQMVSRRTVAEEVRVKSQTISCGNCGENSDIVIGFAPIIS